MAVKALKRGISNSVAFCYLLAGCASASYQTSYKEQIGQHSDDRLGEVFFFLFQLRSDDEQAYQFSGDHSE